MRFNIIVLLLLIVLVLFGCTNAPKAEDNKVFPGVKVEQQVTEQINDNVTNNDANKNNTTITNKENITTNNYSNSNKTAMQTNITINKTTTISQNPKIKSNKRFTTKNLSDIDLNSSDFLHAAEQINSQTKILSLQDLMAYDGYGFYLKSGHKSAYYYDEESDYKDPNDFVFSTVLRYETDYIDDFIANKKFNTTSRQTFNISLGEYNTGYFEYPIKGVYKSIYTIEFVKYDIYVKVVVASKDWMVKKDDVIDYARSIEARIVK